MADPVGEPVLGGTVDVHGSPHSIFVVGATYTGRIKIDVECNGFKLQGTGTS